MGGGQNRQGRQILPAELRKFVQSNIRHRNWIPFCPRWDVQRSKSHDINGSVGWIGRCGSASVYVACVAKFFAFCPLQTGVKAEICSGERSTKASPAPILVGSWADPLGKSPLRHKSFFPAQNALPSSS
jgi:hypothetical protein